jgi:hypothetical protein
MHVENLSVAAAFDLSYADLTSDQQRLFRRLGLHPGTDINAYAAAALDGIDHSAARRGLEALYDQYLIAEPARGRYRLHDLSASRRWASTATSEAGAARPRRSTRKGRCTGSAVTSRRPRSATSRPWNWPVLSPAPGTRLAHWPARAAVPWPLAALSRRRTACGKHMRPLSGSARRRPLPSPPSSKPSPDRGKPETIATPAAMLQTSRSPSSLCRSLS